MIHGNAYRQALPFDSMYGHHRELALPMAPPMRNALTPRGAC